MFFLFSLLKKCFVLSKRCFSNSFEDLFFGCYHVFGVGFPSVLSMINLRQRTWSAMSTRLCRPACSPLPIEFLPHSKFEFDTLRWDPNLVTNWTNPCWYYFINLNFKNIPHYWLCWQFQQHSQVETRVSLLNSVLEI